MKTLVVCSGGLDSVTLAHKVSQEAEVIALLTFNYGQRHVKETEYAAKCADNLGVCHHLLDISNISALLGGSALTDDIDVPEGHYAEDNMRITIVPNRNAIMLTMAYGLAVSIGAERVAAAMHGGDHFIYPDCRPDFIEKFASMQHTALDGVSRVELYTPYLQSTKADIVAEGATLSSFNAADTWSCYQGGEFHCGRCGTCVERQEAFNIAQVADPTIYVDSEYWREAVNAHDEV